MYWKKESERLRKLARELRDHAEDLRYRGAHGAFLRLAEQYDTLAAQADLYAEREPGAAPSPAESSVH